MKFERTCIACRKKDLKQNFIRIISENEIAKVDKSKKKNTRGLYICNNKQCINKLIKAKNLSKCVKINVKTESLRSLLSEMEDM